MEDPHSMKVVLCSPEGRYLAGSPQAPEFTTERAQATVFDYMHDRVGDQLQKLREAHGAFWRAVGAHPDEAYEICDRCGNRVMAFRTYFDGKEFFCPDCRER